MVSAQSAAKVEPIAIVGMGCRLPGGVSSPSGLWNLLANGRSGQSEIPKSRFNLDAFYHKDASKGGSINGTGGYFIQDDTRLFDNAFFGINNLEAKYMDPQQRQLLEVVYECLESASISLEDISGSNVGCYIANFTTDFTTIQAKSPEEYHRYSQTGFGPTILANRISHIFNLHGPSMVLDTACSSSLYALHTACAALNAGECDAAIVAGANLIQSPEAYIAMAKVGVLSGTSICHTFDSSADGYGRAEGVAALFLRRLDTALENGDRVSNGHTLGITLPSAAGQEAVIRKAYAMAGLPLDETAYVEAHGTGTPIGDPIEIQAIFNTLRPKSGEPLLVGSVKTNVGHGEAVSGLSSIIKATLALENGLIPPTIGIRNLNPSLELSERNIEIVTELKYWPKGTIKRISVNSFGYGGANAHAILDSANSVVERSNGVRSNGHIYGSLSPGLHSNGTHTNGIHSNGTHSIRNHFNGIHLNGNTSKSKTYIVPFSANSSKSLAKNIEAIRLLKSPLPSARDLAYTLGAHRTKFSKKDFLLATDNGSGITFSITSSRLKASAGRNAVLPFAFIFTGQGAQWPNMGSELIGRFPVFRKTIQELDSCLANLPKAPSWTIQEILLESTNNVVYKASHSQPICTAIQIALVDLLRFWNIQPAAVIGHSSGEICAAYAAGFITAEEAIAIAYYRGLAVTECCSEGAMIAVGLSNVEVSTQISVLNLNKKLRVACINSPESTTVSGEVEAINALLKDLQDRNMFARKLKTDGKAYHSQLMRPAGQEYEDLLVPVFAKRPTTKGKLADAGVEMFSSVTSQIEDKSMVGTAEYWRRNLESPVAFSPAMEKLLLSDSYCMIEVGPHPALGQPIRDIQQKINSVQHSYFSTLHRGSNSEISMLELAGSLYLQGFKLPFSKINAFDATTPKACIIYDLPSYAWDHQEILWNEPRISSEYRNLTHKRHDLLGSRIPGTPGKGMWWRNILKVQQLPWLQDHKLGDTMVFPAAAYLAMAIEGICQLQSTPVIEGKISLRDVNILNLLVLRPDNDIELSTKLEPSEISGVNQSNNWWSFQISSHAAGTCNIHANGFITLKRTPSDANIESKHYCPDIGLDNHDKQAMRIWYNKLAKEGLCFGPQFRSLTEISTDRSKKLTSAIAKTAFRQGGQETDPEESSYKIHPVTIDSLLQAAILASSAGKIQDLHGKVPVLIHELDILCEDTTRAAEICTIQAESRKVGFGTAIIGAELANITGRIIMQMRDVRAIHYTETSLQTDTKFIRNPNLRILWKPDISLMTTKDTDAFTNYLEHFASLIPTSLSSRPELALFAGAVDMAIHENGRMNILEFSDDSDEDLQEFLEQVTIGKNPKHFETYTKVTVNPAGEFLSWASHGKEENGHSEKLLKTELVYNLILISSPELASRILNKHFDHLSSYLAPNATLIFTDDGNTPIHLASDKISVISASPTGSNSSFTVARGCGNAKKEVFSTGESKIILVHADELHPLDLAIQNQLSLTFQRAITLLSFSEVSPTTIPPNAILVTTIELANPILGDVSEAQLNAIKIMAEQASVLLWITGGRLFKAKHPQYSLVLGLARSLMLERPALKMPVLDLDNGITETATTCSHVVSVLQQLWSAKPDYEYRQYEGILYISRFLSDTALNKRFRQVQDAEVVPLPVEKVEASKLAMKSAAQIDTLHFEEIDRLAELKPGYIEVSVKAVGLNAKDFYALSDKIDIRGSTCGLEFSGVVIRIGSASSGFTIGDRVVVMAPHHFGTSEIVPEWACCKLRDEEDLTIMSTVPLVFSTVLYALENRAHLQSDQSILIHSAAGGAGIAAIQVAQLIGAEIFATVGTDSKKEFLISNFNIPSSHIFSSRDSTFLPQILAATSGKGVDVVLNSLTGELLHESWKALAEFGTFVEIGKRDISDSGRLDMQVFTKATTFTAFDLTDLFWSRNDAQRRVWQRLLYRSVELLREGKVKVISPLKVFPASEIIQAFRYFSQSSRMGKVAVSFEQAATIPVVPSKFRSSFSSDKSYILVGCLGGLGISLSRWMLQRGARNFVYIGRSGTDKVAARNLVEDLKGVGAHVTVIRGDVANYDDVEAAMAAATKPIGGIVQAAMSIHVALFNAMPRSAWHMGITQKVKGVWNLHNALQGRDNQLDFFLMLSSISGSVGTATESNYCAANAFLDAFGAYRRSIGLPGLSVGLGMISEVGFLHKNPDTEAALLRKGIHPFTEEEMLQILDTALTPPAVVDSTAVLNNGIGSKHYVEGHILTGLELHGFQKIRDAGFIRGANILEDPRCSFIAGAFADSENVSTEDTNTANGASFTRAVTAALAGCDSDASSAQINILVGAIQAVVIDRMVTLLLVDLKKLQKDTLLADFGMDSMLAAEFRSDMFRAFKAEVPFAVLMDKRTTIRNVAELIGEKLLAQK
ncbi:hypothetical protein B7494_g3462 [Chlorociboria aeruginascens]|nr:hypothetical protein B7494_g3462 [Chlorociboria aeruginascens]